MGIIKAIKKEIPFFVASPAIIWQILFFYIPLSILIVMSFLQTEGELFFDRVTFDYYRSLFDPLYFFIICRSLLVAFVTAVVTILMAYPVTYFIARMKSRWKNVYLFLLILPFWTNLLVQVYAWFFVLEKYGFVNMVLLKLGVISEPLSLLNNVFAVFIVMVYCYFPFAVMPIYSIIEKLDHRLLEASYDLGATPKQTFFRVVLPLTSSGIMTAFFLIFVVAFGEFVIPALLGGGKQLYSGTLISYFFLLSRNYQLGSAFTLFSMTILSLVIFISYYGLKRLFSSFGVHVK